MNLNLPSRQRGASLLELMIALALGALVIGAITMMYVHFARAWQYQQALSEVQSTGRFATRLIGDDLRRTGFWGRAWQPSFQGAFSGDDDFVAEGSGGYDSEGALRQPLPVWGAPADQACQSGSCRQNLWQGNPATTAQAPLDALFVRYAEDEKDNGEPDTRAPFLIGHDGCAVIVTNLDSNKGCQAAASHWHYYAAAYYLREPSDARVPALYRSVVGHSNPTEIVRNVEALAVEWGHDNDGDGVADQYYTSTNAWQAAGNTPANQLAWWQQVVSARLYLVVRSEALNIPLPAASQTFLLGSRSYPTPNDRRVRRLFSTTVSIRNGHN